jgi:hypothetical protein
LGLGAAWASADFVCAVFAAVLSLRLTGVATFPARYAFHLGDSSRLGFVAVFAVYVLIVGRVLGLYQVVKSKSFLNEERMSVQTALIAALMLCGTLFLTRLIYAPRSVLAVAARGDDAADDAEPGDLAQPARAEVPGRA